MIASSEVELRRERFGKYHVLERIAQGGMAEVYKVKTVGIAGFEKIQALKRMAQADDIGAAIVFLASDEARWITGDTLRVDGGSKL